MKKKIAILLCVFTIIICGWLIFDNLKHLDIASNKTEWYVMDAKRKINERIDIDEFEKKELVNQIDFNRKEQINISNNAFQTQIIASILIVIQILILFLIYFMPNKITND